MADRELTTVGKDVADTALAFYEYFGKKIASSVSGIPTIEDRQVAATLTAGVMTNLAQFGFSTFSCEKK